MFLIEGHFTLWHWLTLRARRALDFASRLALLLELSVRVLVHARVVKVEVFIAIGRASLLGSTRTSRAAFWTRNGLVVVEEILIILVHCFTLLTLEFLEFAAHLFKLLIDFLHHDVFLTERLSRSVANVNFFFRTNLLLLRGVHFKPAVQPGGFKLAAHHLTHVPSICRRLVVQRAVVPNQAHVVAKSKRVIVFFVVELFLDRSQIHRVLHDVVVIWDAQTHGVDGNRKYPMEFILFRLVQHFATTLDHLLVAYLSILIDLVLTKQAAVRDEATVAHLLIPSARQRYGLL
mmetsp:Transcript_1858/g.4231  ORF Transcript_1858/g.4231 Transcript_1858/m.4231 type:complete len:290 (+) Transcript_1858:1211-2080(+)